MLILAVIMSSLIIITSCSNNKNFIGEKSANQVPPECTGQSTLAKGELLSKSIKADATSHTFRYRLTAKYCATGQTTMLENKTILFDYDATYQEVGTRRTTYGIFKDGGSIPLASGDLTPVTGQDLFGKTGEKLSYYKIEQINYSGNLEAIILDIYLTNQLITPLEVTSKSINSYLKVGEAQPIEVMIPISN